MMDREWKHGAAAAVDVTLLGRFYERFADHAVETRGASSSRSPAAYLRKEDVSGPTADVSRTDLRCNLVDF